MVNIISRDKLNDLELVFNNELSHLSYTVNGNEIYILSPKLKVIEDNYLDVDKGILVNEIKIYNSNQITKQLINTLSVNILDNGLEGKVEDDFRLYKIGNKLMVNLSDYMIKMFHPKYKSYLELVSYLKTFT